MDQQEVIQVLPLPQIMEEDQAIQLYLLQDLPIVVALLGITHQCHV